MLLNQSFDTEPFARPRGCNPAKSMEKGFEQPHPVLVWPFQGFSKTDLQVPPIELTGMVEVHLVLIDEYFLLVILTKRCKYKSTSFPRSVWCCTIFAAFILQISNMISTYKDINNN